MLGRRRVFGFDGAGFEGLWLHRFTVVGLGVSKLLGVSAARLSRAGTPWAAFEERGGLGCRGRFLFNGRQNQGSLEDFEVTHTDEYVRDIV